jgi:class 3 adenylate cyclase/pimeloyl-ACP methyl ester carboxylesterase
MEPRIQYATTTDGVSIAYSVAGSGPPLVRVTPAVWNHVEAYWRIAQYRKMAERLAETYTFINYDARGTGLSQKGTEDFRLEARLLDLEAVLAALDVGRCAMLSHIHGCLAAVAYAVRHPERVSKLALVGPFARGVDWQQLPQIRARESYRAMAEEVWEQFRMDVAMGMVDSDPMLARPVADVMAEAMTPATVRLLFQQAEEIDISDLLPRVSLPTLVIVNRNRALADLSREVAARIPGAQVTSVDAPLFFWLPDSAIAALEAFLAQDREGTPAPEQPSGGLVTILFTDIESSTALRQQLGDAKAQELVRAHNAIVRGALKGHGGSEIKHTGDGIMASFPSALGALECAVAIQRGVADYVAAHPEAPLGVYVGLNAGEPIAEERDLFGTSVDLARRLCDEAGPGEILVADVVRQLAAGKEFLFSDRGAAALKGFEDPVRLYEVRWREDG